MLGYCIKSRDLVDTIPADFPHPELISGRWETWVASGATLQRCIEMVERQINMKSSRPQPSREYRIFQKNGRKLTLVWEGKRN